jgi:transposase-like protein
MEPKVCCRHCQSEVGQTKEGRTRFGSQRYLCRACSRVYTPVAKAQGHPASVRQQAVRYSLEGLSQRKIARLLGVAPQSVANWLHQASAKLEEQQVPCVPPEVRQDKGGVVEMDELYSFCQAKRNKKGATNATPPTGST